MTAIPMKYQLDVREDCGPVFQNDPNEPPEPKCMTCSMVAAAAFAAVFYDQLNGKPMKVQPCNCNPCRCKEEGKYQDEVTFTFRE